MNYHHLNIKTQLYTKILCGRSELSKNRKADWLQSQYHESRDPPQLYPYVSSSNLLSARGPEELSAAPILLLPIDALIEEISLYINEKPPATWSPEQIAYTSCVS